MKIINKIYDSLYDKKVEAMNKIIGKKVEHNGIKVEIQQICISLWNNIYMAYVIDDMEQLLIVDMEYDYENNKFIPVGDYKLPY